MAEITLIKRPREETQDVIEQQEEDLFKRQKSYKEILTLLEEEEDEPVEDLSSLISTLQEEISSSTSSSSSSLSSSVPDPTHDPARSGSEIPSTGSGSGSGSEEDEQENVMRHLLEASDDELGIPNSSNVTDGFDEVVGGQVDGGDMFSPVGGEGIWEFEDFEAANYYNMLQSCEIFL
ncbi:uncharacterized protein LOC130809061 [Amaranthus tricolor]|uniref:uncharacterized protein LOC130809061 n=1 Tax=Amaranthus tricolor TaxID=29722 RepID=UPI0025871E1B|nr:uncharacterized protein LOC130809061 [Amaranthus tricolor]